MGQGLNFPAPENPHAPHRLRLALTLLASFVLFSVFATYGVWDRALLYVSRLASHEYGAPSKDGFVTVFEAGRSLAPWWASLYLGFLLVFVFAELLLATRPFAWGSRLLTLPAFLRGTPRWLSWALLVAAVGYTAFSIYERYNAPVVSLLQDRPFHVVEGQVHDFYTDSKSEAFSVGDKRFGYWQWVYSEGFHTIQAHGGNILDGAYVRVSYRGNDILKLEMRRTRQAD